MIIEVCTENITDLKYLLEKSIDRIELCDNLFVGGTTVSFGNALLAKELILKSGRRIELACIIRARGGDFVYNCFEKQVMIKDIELLSKEGIPRIVIGALDNDEDLDIDFIEAMIETARAYNPGIKFTFHMAFDHIKGIDKRLKAIEKLSKMGIDTILTHGSEQKNDIFDNVDVLSRYMKESEKYNIDIMVGGGVTKDNVPELLNKLPGLSVVHGTKIV